MQISFNNIMHGWIDSLRREEADGDEMMVWLQEQIHDDSEDRLKSIALESGTKPVEISEGMIFQFYPDSLSRRLEEIREENIRNPMRYVIAKCSTYPLSKSFGEFIIWRMFWNNQYNTAIMLGMFHRISKDASTSREQGKVIERQDGRTAFSGKIGAGSTCGFLMLEDVSPLMLQGHVTCLGKVSVD
jgi:hypothetical protein